MIKKYFYPSIGQSLLLVLIFIGFQVVIGVIAGIILLTGYASISSIYIAVLLLSPACTALTVLYGTHKSKMPLREYLVYNVKNKKVVIYSILFFIGVYFASNFLGGLMQNIMPSNESVDAIYTQGFNSPIGIFAMVVLAPVFEECLFRGVMLRGFLKNYSITKSLIITSLIFGLMHFNLIQSIIAAILGLALGWVFIKTGSLPVCILLHALNNGISTILYKLTVNYNVSDSQLNFVVILSLLAGITAFILLRRMPDNISHIYKERDEALLLIREQEASEVNAPQLLYYKPLKHSGPGIASFIISLITWAADAMSLTFTFVSAFVFEDFGRSTLHLMSSVITFSSFTAITGLILGVIGASNKHRKKIFPVLGIVINTFIILSLIFLLFIGFSINRMMPVRGINL